MPERAGRHGRRAAAPPSQTQAGLIASTAAAGGTTEQALIFLVFAEMLALVLLRRSFRTAHGG